MENDSRAASKLGHRWLERFRGSRRKSEASPLDRKISTANCEEPTETDEDCRRSEGSSRTAAAAPQCNNKSDDDVIAKSEGACVTTPRQHRCITVKHYTPLTPIKTPKQPLFTKLPKLSPTPTLAVFASTEDITAFSPERSVTSARSMTTSKSMPFHATKSSTLSRLESAAKCKQTPKMTSQVRHRQVPNT